MNKNFKYYLGTWIALFAIFNVATFVSPNETAEMTKFGGAFWAGYVFIILAFLGQLAVSFKAFRAENLQKFFYNIPLIRISWSGLVLTLIVGVLCMVIPNLPNWVGIIVCFAILAFYAISLVKASVAANLVSEVDETIKEKTFFIKSMIADAEALLAQATSAEAKSACKKVYEAVRYSDPMSSDMLASVEDQIAVKFTELSGAVAANDAAVISSSVEEILLLVKERNSKCKLLK